MAARTTVQAGLASAGTTWNGGTPLANGDTFTISHAVVWDVDHITSGITLGASTIAAGGSITASTTPGTYSLKMSGTLTLTGGFGIHGTTSADQYPSNCQFNIISTLTGTTTLFQGGRPVLYGNGSNITITGVNASSGIVFNSPTYIVLNGVSISSFNRLVYSAYFADIRNCSFADCSVALYFMYGGLCSSSTFTNCAYGTRQSIFLTMHNCTFGGTGTAIFEPRWTALKNCLLSTSGSEFGGYVYSSMGARNYAESIDHDQVAGAYKAACAGGTVDLQTSVTPSGRASSYLHTCTDVNGWNIRQTEHTIEPGETISVACWLRKNASHSSYLPRIQILSKWDESALDSFTMTDSVDAWETDTLAYTNSGATPAQIIIRARGDSSTLLWYEDYEVTRYTVADLNAVADIRLGTPRVDGETGTCAVPAAADVRLGVAVDDTTGTLSTDSPDPADVRAGVDTGGETGTLAVPEPEEVLAGVATDDTVGLYVAPSASDVRLGVDFGVEETGTLIVPAAPSAETLASHKYYRVSAIVSIPGSAYKRAILKAISRPVSR